MESDLPKDLGHPRGLWVDYVYLGFVTLAMLVMGGIVAWLVLG